MNALALLDRYIFLFINTSYHSSFFDTIALVFSGVGTAGMVWFLLAFWLFVREEKKGPWFFAPLFGAGAMSWFLVEVLLKPIVARSRPGLELGTIIVGSQSDTFSFPSGHATIAFAMAVVLAQKEPRWKWMFYTLAVLISLSRIYLGVHYPLDVIVGGVIGWSIGRLSTVI